MYFWWIHVGRSCCMLKKCSILTMFGRCVMVPGHFPNVGHLPETSLTSVDIFPLQSWKLPPYQKKYILVRGKCTRGRCPVVGRGDVLGKMCPGGTCQGRCPGEDVPKLRVTHAHSLSVDIHFKPTPRCHRHDNKVNFQKPQLAEVLETGYHNDIIHNARD